MTEHFLGLHLDADKITKAVEAMQPKRPRARLDLRQLPALERDLFNIKFQLADVQKSQAGLRPDIEEAKKTLKAKREALATLESEAKSMNLRIDSGAEFQRLKSDIERLEDTLDTATQRLDGLGKIAAKWQGLLDSFPMSDFQELKRAEALLA